LKKQIDELQSEEEKQPLQTLLSEFDAAIQKEDYAALKDLITQFNNLQAQNTAQTGSGPDDAIETDFSTEK
jgi:hypothetical protein